MLADQISLKCVRMKTRLNRLIVMAALFSIGGTQSLLAGTSIPDPDPVFPIAYCYGSGTCCQSSSSPAAIACCTPDQPESLAGEGGSTTPSTTSLSCTSQGNYSTCSGLRTCCFTDGTSIDADGRCCDDLGGVAGPLGTSCEIQACCTDSDLVPCVDAYPWQCSGGVFAGTGTSCATDEDICTNAIACCKPEHDPPMDGDEFVPWCDNHLVYNCVYAFNGTLLSFDDCNSPPCTCIGLANYDSDFDGIKDNDLDGDDVIDDCDNCADENELHSCAGVACSNVYQEDTDMCVGGPYDGYGPCPSLCEAFGGGQCIGDGIGNVCDNCPGALNSDQTDTDGDGLGDACDDCPNIPSGPIIGTCFNDNDNDPSTPHIICFTNTDCDTSSGAGDGCCITANQDLDNDGQCDFLAANCDEDCMMDIFENDCDGDGTPDDCDNDIDDDGVDNDLDACDFTPSYLHEHIITDSTSALYGTVPHDIDGDCDVDQDDVDALELLKSDPGCADGQDKATLWCPQTP